MAPKFPNSSPAFPSGKSLGAWLRGLKGNPSAIAALASLGAHGLLFGVLPFLPDTATQATEAEIRNPVDVVELTPEEQQRLPDLATLPPVELPPLSPPTGSGLFRSPGLAKPPTSSSISPSDSLLAPPPPLPIFIPPIAPPTQIPSFTLRLPQSLPPTVVQPAPVAPSPPARQPASPPTSPQPNAAAPANPSPSPPVEPSPTSEAEPQQTATAPSPSPRTEQDIQRDLLARQQELKELYTYNPSGTSVADANTSFLDWYSQAMGAAYSEEAAEPERKTATVDFPKLACPLKPDLSKTDGKVRTEVGVVVDADNQLLGEPTVIQSSGYRLFNQEALNLAKTYNFENQTGERQVYLLRVEFVYSEEACPPGLQPLPPAS